MNRRRNRKGRVADDSPRISSLQVLNSRLTQASAVVGQVWGVAVRGAHLLSVVRCMDKLTEDAVHEVEKIHSSWIEFEVAGDDQSMLALCADDIELWPPDVHPVCGRAAVSAQLAHGTTRIHGVEISDRRIRGSNEIAYLTANYRVSFSSAEDFTSRQALGAICGYCKSAPVRGLSLS